MSDNLDELLRNGPVAINIGVEDFADSLKAQKVEVVNVTWSPPAGGDQDLIDLLDKLL